MSIKSPHPGFNNYVDNRVRHGLEFRERQALNSEKASEFYRKGVVRLPPLTRGKLTAAEMLPHAVALCREHTMPFCTKCGVTGTESYEEAVARKLKESGICRLDDGTIVRQENPTVTPRKMSFAERLVKNG